MKNIIFIVFFMIFSILLTGYESSKVIKGITIDKLLEILKGDVRTRKDCIVNHTKTFDINFLNVCYEGEID